MDNEKVLIGNIDKIQPYKDRLYILDTNIAKGVFVFNKNGKFIQKIGNLGNGPGEYVSCQDFTINKAKEEILIYDTYHERIYIYDMKSGKYRNHIDIKDKNKIEYIWMNNERLYGVDSYFTDNTRKSYYILQQIDERTGETIAEWMEASQYNKNGKDEFIPTPLFFPIDKDKDLFAFGLCDSIMCIEKGKLYSYIALTGKRILNTNDIPKGMISSSADVNIRTPKSKDFFHKLLTLRKFAYIPCVFEHNDYIYIDYSSVASYNTIRYNKTTKETSIYRFLKNDLLYSKEPGSHSLPSFMTSDDKGTYQIINSDHLPEIKDSAQEDGVISNRAVNKNVLKELDENSNPIILYYDYKE